MENYPAYTYPDSATSSPRSREPDFDTNTNSNTLSWDDQSNPTLPPNHKVKFMVSYNGKIQPRSHDNLLSYIGGDTKILSVERSIKFPLIYSKLASLVADVNVTDAADFTFKYQLPGEDLDALISVTNDDDLEHMMHEYDRMSKGSAKPARLRLFLFFDSKSRRNSGCGSAFSSVSSEPGKLAGLDRSDGDLYRQRQNTVVSDPVEVVSPSDMQIPVNNNVDFLFGLDKESSVQVPGSVPVHVQTNAFQMNEPAHEPEIIHDLNRIHHQMQHHQLQQSAMYAAKHVDNYGDRDRQPAQHANFPANIQAPVQMPQGYWQQMEQQHQPPQQPQQLQPPQQPPPQMQQHQQYHPQQHQQQQPVYMMHAPPQGNVYHAPMMQPNHGFYQQRMPSDQGAYMEQPVYNTPATIPAMIPAGNTAAQVRPGESGGYSQVAYDQSTGRQIYYAAAPPGRVVTPPPYSGIVAATSGGDMRGSGDGKVVQKVVTNPTVV